MIITQYMLINVHLFWLVNKQSTIGMVLMFVSFLIEEDKINNII